VSKGANARATVLETKNTIITQTNLDNNNTCIIVVEVNLSDGGNDTKEYLWILWMVYGV